MQAKVGNDYSATKAMAIELAPYECQSQKKKLDAIAPVAGKTPLLKSFMGGNSRKKNKHSCPQYQLKIFNPTRYGDGGMFLVFR